MLGLNFDDMTSPTRLLFK